MPSHKDDLRTPDSCTLLGQYAQIGSQPQVDVFERYPEAMHEGGHQ